ncbi:hypothetical protein KCTC32516_01513 [Polaribacter huanghezhanensis]|uniref:hypothetical protein n=1 Tax=Polaribacter huanghezhanensis TaxID=1354726 RepID=UPI002648FA98|nr:hypothetical protein [Polaribacter huanghezhanensis]WKD86154.1 hypothetical protein KCTC32516_01513 [Polaribacter huanghezhanensis]
MHSQEDKIGAKKTISIKAKTTSVNKSGDLNFDATKGFKNAYNNSQKTQAQKDLDLKNKGIISQAKINEERILKAYKKINGRYQYPKIDQDLGSFRTDSNNITIICRDFQYPDGDMVTILVNDIPIIRNITLERNYKKFTIPIGIGINKIAFIALNQGTSGPNTAAFKVYDDKNNLISSNEWNLATGAVATILIAKDK